MKNRSLNMIKTMLKTSYDTSEFINEETGKLNKKSIKLWILIILAVIIICINYVIVNSLKKIGAQSVFLDLFFMMFEILVMFEASILVLNILYFQDDIKNYIYMPISNFKLMIMRLIVVLSIIMGTELLIAVPSIFIFGIRTIKEIWFYPISLIVIFLTTIFLTAIIAIISYILIKIFRFLRNKKLYQNIVTLIMTILIIIPLFFSIKNMENYANDIVETNEEISYTQDEEIENIREELNELSKNVFKLNKILLVPDLGIKALSELNLKSVLYLLEILIIDLILFAILIIIENKTYLNSVLYIISMYNKRRVRKINLKNKCKKKKKEIAYLKNEFRTILKSQIYFMKYIYNALIILLIVVLFACILTPLAREIININQDIIPVFDFEIFSIIIGIIQVLFMISAPTLTAFSRYGRNAKFFKFIPIDLKKQFLLKTIPGLLINTIIIITVLTAVRILFLEIGFTYILLMFVVSMIINLINNYILLFIDLWRPQLSLDSEISVVNQNENKLLKYILTAVMCLCIWYIKEITQNLDMNKAIIVEISIFIIIFIILNVILVRKKDKLFKKIM